MPQPKQQQQQQHKGTTATIAKTTTTAVTTRRLWTIALLVFLSCSLCWLFVRYQRKQQRDGRSILKLFKQEQRSNANGEFVAPLTKDKIADDNEKGGIVSTPIGNCKGKERWVQILRDAGWDDTDTLVSLCPLLPSEKQVAKLYGSDGPIVHGLDRCEEYRNLLKNASSSQLLRRRRYNRNLRKNNSSSSPLSAATTTKTSAIPPVVVQQKPIVRVAGLFNSGTNALARLLMGNLRDAIRPPHPCSSIEMFNVPWGKHVPVRYKWRNVYPRKCKGTFEEQNKDLVLPVVAVRDPYRWMKATCKQPYEIKFNASTDEQCNLVVVASTTTTALAAPPATTTNNHHRLNRLNVSLGQTRNRYTDYYDSLAEMWSEWLGEYLDADFPRLFVRYEDLLFHAEEVTRIIRRCVSGRGGSKNSGARIWQRRPGGGEGRRQEQHQRQNKEQEKPFRLVLEDTRSWLRRPGGGWDRKMPYLAAAMVAYGTEKDRYFGYSARDLDHAADALDPLLMRLFRYPPSSSPSPSSSSPSRAVVPGEGGGDERTRSSIGPPPPRRYQDWPDELVRWQREHYFPSSTRPRAKSSGGSVRAKTPRINPIAVPHSKRSAVKAGGQGKKQ